MKLYLRFQAMYQRDVKTEVFISGERRLSNICFVGVDCAWAICIFIFCGLSTLFIAFLGHQWLSQNAGSSTSSLRKDSPTRSLDDVDYVMALGTYNFQKKFFRLSAFFSNLLGRLWDEATFKFCCMHFGKNIWIGYGGCELFRRRWSFSSSLRTLSCPYALLIYVG